MTALMKMMMRQLMIQHQAEGAHPAPPAGGHGTGSTYLTDNSDNTDSSDNSDNSDNTDKRSLLRGTQDLVLAPDDTSQVAQYNGIERNGYYNFETPTIVSPTEFYMTTLKLHLASM